MKEIEQLIKEYKKTKDKKILDQIFKLLNEVLKEKAKYVFYKQSFFGIDGLKLCETKKVELNDVLQELYLEILRIIENYNIKEPFENYLNANLKSWKPKFINAEFLKIIKTQSIYRTNNEGDEEDLADNLSIPEPVDIEFINPLTEIEQRIWDLLQEDLNITQEHISKELGLSQQDISRLISSIKEKIQK